MKLLVLGGTQFVGRHIVEAALARGHAVTLFHRGQTNPGLFPQTQEILGDRDGGLGALRGGTWDAVIDVNGYVPRLVGDSVRALSGAAGYYVFISTLSVLADYTIPDQDERAPRVPFKNISTEEITGETYGPLKAACEAEVEKGAAGRYAILRPGFIVGPWDHTGRFNYWLRRASEGGTMLAPGDSTAPVQFIDARDLAAFVLRSAEAKKTGTFHAVGPREPWTWGALFQECGRTTGVDMNVVWVPEKFLDACGIKPGELPMRFRGADGLSRTSSARAIAEGLAFRPVGDTVRDTLAWNSLHGRRDVGLTPERERELLSAWGQVNQAV